MEDLKQVPNIMVSSVFHPPPSRPCFPNSRNLPEGGWSCTCDSLECHKNSKHSQPRRSHLGGLSFGASEHPKINRKRMRLGGSPTHLTHQLEKIRVSSNYSLTHSLGHTPGRHMAESWVTERFLTSGSCTNLVTVP